MGRLPRWILLTVCAAVVPACDNNSSDPPEPPNGAPSSLLLAVVSTARIDLAWTDNSTNEAWFLIERSTDDITYTQVGMVPLNQTTYTDFGLQPNTQYFYRVRGFTDAGTSAAATGNATTMALTWAAPVANPGPLAARSNHSAVYHSAGQRMLVFGGVDTIGTLYNDVWALDLSGAALSTGSWSSVTTTGTPPTERLGHSAIFDSLHNRMIVFGGIDGVTGFVADVWILDLATAEWSQATVSGPAPVSRWRHTTIYDPQGQRMVVFGGDDGSTEFDDVRFLSLANPTVPLPGSTSLAWTNPSPAPGPLKRTAHSAIFDPDRKNMVTFAGTDNDPTQDGSTYSNETWTLGLGATNQWTLLTFPGTPSLRAGHSAVYDTDNRRMVVFGGEESPTPPFNQQLWSLNLFTTPQWSILNPGGSVPTGRIGHSAVYDPQFMRMIIFGGDDGTGTMIGSFSAIGL